MYRTVGHNENAQEVQTMKRGTFLITSTVGHNVTKHAWNSANREAQRLMHEWADQQTTADYPMTWRLVESASEKVGKFHVSGVRKWKSDAGREVSFFISKVE